MSQGLSDLESWRRAWGPAMRTFGYISALYVITFLSVVIPAQILIFLGIAPEVISGVATLLVVIMMVFSIFLAFFKVLDEERPGVVPLT